MTKADFSLIAASLKKSKPARTWLQYPTEIYRWKVCVMQLCADFDANYGTFTIASFLIECAYAED